MILAVLGSGGFVYAKYFSEAARYGIAIASGVYFSANYAAESEEFFECSVGYSGGNYDFDFEVRNYENNMLFNESGVEIPYSVSFWLGEEVKNATYSVKIKDSTGESQVIGIGKEHAIEFTGQSLAGGVALANKYTINIVVTENAVHEPVPIYVLAKTDAGASITKTLTGKMVLSNKTSYNSCYIVSQDFVIPDESSAGETNEFVSISKLSMFTYEIRTAGELASGEVTEQLKLSWNPNVLEIDLFDDAYLKWLDSKDYQALVAAGTELDKNGIPTDEKTGDKYILMEVVPYSAQSVGFFRGNGFDTIADMDALNAAIVGEIYTG